MIAYRFSKYRQPHEVKAEIRFTGKVYSVDCFIRPVDQNTSAWRKVHTFRCRTYKMAQQAHDELNAPLVWFNPVFERPSHAKGM